MKKVPDVSTRKRGRPPKKHLAMEASTSVASAEGTQPSVTDVLEAEVNVPEACTDTGSEKQTFRSEAKRHGGKSVSLGSTKATGKKKQRNSSSLISSDGKISESNSGKTSKDSAKPLLSKVVKQGARKVSQRVTSSVLHILRKGRPKLGLQVPQKKKSKLKKFSRKVARMKSMKTEANELKDTITTEMKRLLTTDGFWSTKVSSRSNSPHSQSADSQRQAAAGKKDSRTSTPDITPSTTRRQSLTKPPMDKDDNSPVPKSNIPGSKQRRSRTAEGLPSESAVVSRTSSRDVSPCSSSSLDRGTRLSSRVSGRGHENKHAIKGDADQITILSDGVSAKQKVAAKKESYNGKEKLPGDHGEVSETVTPVITDSVIPVNFESPVSRFRKKHFLDKAANIAKQKRFPKNIRSRKALSVMEETSKRSRLKNSSAPADSVTEDSSMNSKLSTSTNMPQAKQGRKLSTHCVKKEIRGFPKGKVKRKHKQRNISDVGTLEAHTVLEGGLENSLVAAESNIPLASSVSSAKSWASADLTVSDLFDSGELKRLNTTAGFWSPAPSVETVLTVNQPRKLREVDGSLFKETNGYAKSKPVRKGNVHLANFNKTLVAPKHTLLQQRKKRLHSLQSKLMKTEQCVPSNELAEQEQSSADIIPTQASAAPKPRLKPRLFGFRRHRRKRDPTLADGTDTLPQETPVSIELKASISEVNSKDSTELTDTSETEYEKDVCMQKDHSTLRSIEVDIEEHMVSVDLSPDRHDGCTDKHSLEIETYKKQVGSGLNAKTPQGTTDLGIDRSVDDTPIAQKSVLKTSKRGCRGLRLAEAAPASRARTRGQIKVVNTLDDSLEVMQNVTLNKDDDAVVNLLLTTSDVVNKRRRGKKKMQAKSDLSESTSGTEIDQQLSDQTRVADIVNPQIADEDKQLDTQTTTETQTTTVEKKNNIEKLVLENAVKQISGHKKDNLFESLGFSLHRPSDTSPASCVNILAADVKEPCSTSETVVEPQLVTTTHPTVNNVCDKSMDDSGALQAELSITTVSDSIESIRKSQELTNDGLETADIVNDFVGVIDADCKDVSHGDSFNDTSGSLQKLQSIVLSESGVSSEALIGESVTADSLKASFEQCVSDIHRCALQDEALLLPANVTLKCENFTLKSSDMIDSYSHVGESTSNEITTDGASELKCDDLEKKEIDEKSTVNGGAEETNELYISKLEHHSEQIILPESSLISVMSANVHSIAIVPTSVDVNISEEDKDKPSSISETEVGKSNVVKEKVDFENIEQFEMVKMNEFEAADKTLMGDNSVGKVNDAIDSPAHKCAVECEISVSHIAHASRENLDLKLQNQTPEAARLISCKICKLTKTAADESICVHLTDVPKVDTDCLNSCVETADIKLNEELLEATTELEVPVKRARKRKRNSWQRGVLRKAARMSRKVTTFEESVSPKQKSEEPVSPKQKFEEPVSPKQKFEESVSPKQQFEETVSPKQQFEEPVSPKQSFEEPVSPRLSKTLAPTSLLNDDQHCLSDGAEKMDTLTSALCNVTDENNQCSHYVQEDNILHPTVSSSDADEHQVSNCLQKESTVRPSLIVNSSHADEHEQISNRCVSTDLNKSTEVQATDGEHSFVSVPLVAGDGNTVNQGTDNPAGEKGQSATDTYTPVVTKSLKNMLKKLETNANLAHADFGVQAYKGKFLRNVQRKEEKQKRMKVRRKVLHVDQTVEANSDEAVTPSDVMIKATPTGISDVLVKKKRGRPKKKGFETLPKLTPVRVFPLLRSVAPWNKTPPDLSPQDVMIPQFLDTVESKNTQDAEFVCESVDDTDLHLYLSGISDEEQSPRKDAGHVSDAGFGAELSTFESVKVSNDLQTTNTDQSFSAEDSLTNQKHGVLIGREPRKRGRPRKGSRGRPPGIPMTDEEKLKRKNELKLKRRKTLKTFDEECEGENVYRFLHSSPRSVEASVFFNAPTFSGSPSTPTGNFSLRKKSTRSPLEMLAMKRKQEEAIYDLEQEKRQARLIHLREKRSARESGEGFSEDDDDDGETTSDSLMTCTVVLNDFVKKLQLDELELSSGEDISHEASDGLRRRANSPDGNSFEDRDEDWRADFEEYENDEWNNNRPSIPRLKLKRVIKKGTPSQIKRSKLKAQSPQEKQHVPIKLVIKTEPAIELNEQAGARSNSGTELSKVERSGFENSFMNFLKKKGQSQPVLGKSDVSKKSSVVAKSSQLDSRSNAAADLSAVEILSLPAAGIRSTLTTSGVSLIRGVQIVSSAAKSSSSSSASDKTPSLAQVDTDKSSGKPTAIDNTGTAKPVVSAEDEDDDILILDLEDGTVEQSCDELPLPTGSASSSVHQPALMNHNSLDNQEVACQEQQGKNNNSQIDIALLSRFHRSFSNDEMGLMFESYNGPRGQDRLNQADAAHDAGGHFICIESSGTLSGSETRCLGDISQPLTSGDTSTKASPVQYISGSVPEPGSAQAGQEPRIVGLSEGSPRANTEVCTRDTAEANDSYSTAACSDVTSKDISYVGLDGGEDSSHSKQQTDGDGIPKVSKAANKINKDTLIELSISDAQKDTNSHLNSDVLATTSSKADHVAEGAASDNISSCTSSLKTTSFKKPGVVVDNSKSPKHSTYRENVPEDWRVKVILQSDKFPSGKYSCKRCSFMSPSKLTIESHIYSHIPGVQFRCAYCESEFSSMAATSSHLKNTHSVSEAKLHISRHIDEKNFYEKEAAVFPEETGQQSPVHPSSTGTNAGGQSPPVIISLVVSSRAGRPTVPAHRFVCTHCGFSTNVKEDAEHHVLDLHSSQALFACLLCSENICYTESEIKDHCAVVHPARKQPYKKLPDFYDAELLSLKEKTTSQDDKENIFERMSSLFQDETQASISNIDHKQKAKEYLYLQEGWKEKTKVEADSTTAVDYTDDHDSGEEQPAPGTPAQEENFTDNIHHTAVGENEAFDGHRSTSLVPDASAGGADLCETTALINDDFITSSAGAAPHAHASSGSQVESHTCAELQSQLTVPGKDFSQLKDGLSHPADEAVLEDHHGHPQCHIGADHDMEDNDDDGGGMGLKIVQVVSLSEHNEDTDAQMAAEREHLDTDDSAGDSAGDLQTGTVSSGASTTTSKARELLATEHSSAIEENIVKQTDSSGLSSSEKDAASSGAVVFTNPSTAADNSTELSPAASPSFAGGLPLSYKCNACKVHTPYLLMMVKHLKAKHPNMKCFSCPYCKTAQSFVSQKQLRHHVKQSHPTMFGRNEIALSEDAKKFVEAMVLPIGPECIRVGNRIVLEEDIHTCTYCQVKLVSLTSVYEHLNTKHTDLFEFVCPVCQSFRSKMLPEIFEHCLSTHKSNLDTDKVHVSVPKNLFTALTCISKSGKYIEKTLAAGSAERALAGTSLAPPQQSGKSQSVPRQKHPPLTEGVILSKQYPLSEMSSVSTPLVPAGENVPAAHVMQPVFALPLTSTSVGAVPAIARPAIAFSSALFDTSSLTPPQLAVTSHPIPVIQNAAASSFLSPLPQQAHSNNQHAHSSKQAHSKSSERAHSSVKNLPVLNVPTIRPRASPMATKTVTGTPAGLPPQPPNSNTVMSASRVGQQSMKPVSSSSAVDNLPDDEPNPDAFKIFNLCPTGPRISPLPVSPLTPGVPTVFPPVSSPLAAGYIQGTVAGFPPGMVISPNLLPISFPYSQHQSVMQGLLAQKQNPQSSPLSRHPHLSSHPPTSLMAAQSVKAIRSSIPSEEAAAAATAYLKKQQRELYLKKQQRQQLLDSHRYHFKHSQHPQQQQQQQQAVPRAHPAHQQPPSLSGQVYQPQPHPVQTVSYDHQQMLGGPADLLHTSLFSSSLPPSSSSSLSTTGPSSAHLVLHGSPNLPKPSKGVHKRSSSLYQCPYCPVMVTLKALEVASHIQQHHPGRQVAFKKIV